MMEPSPSIMKFSPYLTAIQQVPGKLYGEKIRSITQIAEKIIKDCENTNAPIEVYLTEELPEVLIPLIRLRIAEILKKPEGILDALKSEDQFIFEQALKLKWFFHGSIENHPNAHYFQENIFPYIPINNRHQIIKAIAANLTISQQNISEEFYSTIMEAYNCLEAQPFLVNCSGSFIDHVMTHYPIAFDFKELKKLIQNHYDIAIKYLKLCASPVNSITKRYPPLETYHKILVYLLKNDDLVNLVELLEMHAESSSFKFHLGRNFTEIFVENEFELLVEKSHLFMPILSLDEVSEKLPKSKFQMVFKNLFPRKIEEFDFQHLYDYLKYFPEDEKLPFMLSTFEEVYQVSLLDCDRKITTEVLKVLPSSERIKQARKKVKADQNWYTVPDKIENSWVCYLPTEESIPILKKRIFKTTDNYQKIELINQMIYTCKVNNDIDTLLDVLEYVVDQHRNGSWPLLGFLARLPVDFEMQYLPEEHWDVLNEFIDHYDDKEKIFIIEKDFQDILIWGIYHDLMKNLSINNKMEIVTKWNIDACFSRWNLFKNIPKFEKACIEKFMELIPRIYIETYDNRSWPWPDIIYSFMEAIYDFNKRNSKSEVENIYIKNNPLFLDEVQKLVNSQFQNYKYFPKIKEIKQLLKINEPDLCYLWIEENRQSIPLRNGSLIQIENDYQNILNNWEEYYEYCKNHIDQKSVQQYIFHSRWYQDVPIKFLSRCLKDIKDNKDKHALKFLAILVEGSVFEEFIKSEMSNLTNIDNEVNTKKYLTKLDIAEALRNRNTVPSLEFIAQFFHGNDSEINHKCFIKIAQTLPADKVIRFCQMIMNRSSSLSKLCINLIHDIATSQQLRQIFTDLWRMREHHFINIFLVKNIKDAFIEKPCIENWEMLKECFTSFDIKNQRIIKYIVSFHKVPNEYIIDYIKLVLDVFKKMKDKESGWEIERVGFYICDFLGNFPNHFAEFFSEELHEEILETYLVDLSLPENALFAAQKYLINCYILPAKDKLDSRLKFFSGLFMKILQSEQEIYDADSFTSSYPVHNFLQGLIRNLIPISYSPTKIKLINAIIDTFLFVLKPQDAPEFYCKFVLTSVHDNETSPREFGRKIAEIIPGLIDSSVVFVSIIARSLSDLFYHFYLDFAAEGQLDIIESLIESNNDNNTLLAANCLLWQNFEMQTLSRFWNLVRFLKKHRNVAVVSCANLLLSEFQN